MHFQCDPASLVMPMGTVRNFTYRREVGYTQPPYIAILKRPHQVTSQLIDTNCTEASITTTVA